MNGVLQEINERFHVYTFNTASWNIHIFKYIFRKNKLEEDNYQQDNILNRDLTDTLVRSPTWYTVEPLVYHSVEHSLAHAIEHSATKPIHWTTQGELGGVIVRPSVEHLIRETLGGELGQVLVEATVEH